VQVTPASFYLKFELSFVNIQGVTKDLRNKPVSLRGSSIFCTSLQDITSFVSAITVVA